jgi:diaminobutyrate-2-oxoglutarate transaminase
MVLGLGFDDAPRARQIASRAFELGLIIETAGPDDQVVKLLPSLTMDIATLSNGLDILTDAATSVSTGRDEGLEAAQ